MPTTVPDEERERRFQALDNHDTVTAAANHLDMSLGALADWGKKNYPGYDEEFSKNKTSETGFLGLLERVDSTLASLQDDLENLSSPRLSHQDRRRVRGALSDVEWLRDYIQSETSIQSRGGGPE